ncbi:hypothetical protein RBH29_16530 [Herbivorax sp. ANBcel31]|uniref:hypothetical protein n=1 Tax=Herbivorax sp. ANBcel31 TaxID=3069754 RepID=UPI0027B435BB|nr:hypothetical protein [Herbivorax sp. ANBcel31]MDQ2088035.1 hypothetical protein [Herbivorax sp. ANBcel31]
MYTKRGEEMNMKRIVTGIISIVMIGSVMACSNTANKPDMHIEKAQISEQEENIAKLLGLNIKQPIYDFKLDKNVKSIQINTYELTDGACNLVAVGGRKAFSDDNGSSLSKIL